VLTAGRNADLLIEQALRFVPSCVVISDESRVHEVRDALSRLPVTVLAGNGALSEVVCLDNVDLVLTAMVGFSGLLPTWLRSAAGKTLPWPIRRPWWWPVR